MERRVLVLEKSLHQRKVLKRKLDMMVSARIVTLGEEDIISVCSEFQPSHVIIYLNDMAYDDMTTLYDVLKVAGVDDHKIILLGTLEECQEFKKKKTMDEMIEIRRPVSICNFLLSIRDILNCDGEEEICMDVYKRNILVIDDNPISLKSMKRWLEDTFSVSIVNSGRMALKFLEKKEADLILMDYVMPDMDGKETLRRIRDNKKTKNIPVFFLTGVNDNEQVAEVMKLNTQGYFLKTTQKEEVVAAIASFLDVL